MSAAEGAALLALAALLAHEVDAAARGEWRILPVLRRMEEARARDAFLLLHLPLSLALLAGMGWGGEGFRMALALFCIAHPGLHALWRDDALADFTGWPSRLLIWLPAAAGAAHVALR